jgi:hypothetical protein
MGAFRKNAFAIDLNVYSAGYLSAIFDAPGHILIIGIPHRFNAVINQFESC